MDEREDLDWLAAQFEEHRSQLRTIAYRLRSDRGDKREDLVVVFTIVRQDSAGNVTFIWRRLQNRASPKISLEE